MKLSEVGEEKPRTMKLSEVETAPPSQMEETKEFFRGAALPAFGVMQSIPYEPIQKFATEKVQQRVLTIHSVLMAQCIERISWDSCQH